MIINSAGILCYRYRDQTLEVFLVHPGGPFWAKRDEGAWSLPKGLINPGEAAMDAAKREFNEETSFEVIGELIDLGQLTQPSKKIVHAWAVHMDLDASKLKSNMFSMEWPKGTGVIREYPEVDKGEWFSLARAKQKISPGQAAFIERLLEKLT